jgi:prevent-host-death family protein
MLEINMGSWQVQDAKARFTEFLNTALKKGPQVVTRRGVETAVLVPIEDWRRMKQSARPSLKSLLLADENRFEDLVPARGGSKRRPAVEFK